MNFKWHTAILIGSFVLVLVVGTFIYHNVEGWGYLDSTYFMVITATTIGYGDFTPQTMVGKITTMVYSLIGITFVFYAISLISHRVFEQKMEERVEDIKEKKAKIKKLKKSVQKA